MVRASLAVSLLVAAPSCPDLYSLATHGFTVPTLQAASATAAPDPAGMRMTVAFAVTNPNPFPLSLSGVEYQVALRGTPVFAGTQQGLSVSEHGGITLSLPGVVDLHSAIFRQLVPGASASYTISGVAHVDSPAGVPIEVEFSRDGTVLVPSQLPAAP